MTGACPFCALLEEPQDSPTFIAAFENSVAFLNFAQESYPGQSLLILRGHHEHLHLTPVTVQRAVVPELARLTAAVLGAFGGFRANHQSLGNQVAHVHWHVTPRYPGDLNAGGPPVHSPDFTRLRDEEYRARAARIRAALEQGPPP